MNTCLTISFLERTRLAKLLPRWILQFVDRASHRAYTTEEERLLFAIELSRINVREGTGGPFGAAVFDLKSGKLLGLGVNRVVPLGDPTAHAEILSLRMACKVGRNYSLRAARLTAGLYVSSEPCGMCATAGLWAGVDAITYGATSARVESLGFDEGLKPKNWKKAILRRGVAVRGGLLSSDASRVLDAYRARRGILYNG